MAEKMGLEARIAHFLRVAEDGAATQAERDVAGREAERLIAKHAIDRLTLDVAGAQRAEREPIERGTVVVTGGRGTVALDVVLGLVEAARSLGLIAHYRDRRTVDTWSDGPDAKPHVELVVTGFRSDVALAVPLLESLQLQAALAVRTWWRSEPRHRLIPKYDALLSRCAFAQGFGRGAAERLRVNRDEAGRDDRHCARRRVPGRRGAGLGAAERARPGGRGPALVHRVRTRTGVRCGPSLDGLGAARRHGLIARRSCSGFRTLSLRRAS